jgi:glucose-1-phosphate thymidylyltransferase
MTSTRKAVILARGLGTRMKRQDDSVTLSREQASAADAGIKGMMPIGRPFLDYVVSALADAGITEVCLVIGPEHDAVRAHYARETNRVRIHCANQKEPRGTADAVAAAEAFVGGETFLVLNADNYYPVDACRRLAALGCAGLVGFNADALVAQGNIDRDRVRAFALITTDAEGALETIVEKPDESTYTRLAPISMVSMNLWSFTPAIFEGCRRVSPSARGELELQDAVRIARAELGERFQVVPYAGGVLDLSHRNDVPAVAAALAGVVVRL